jgi:hypothetical protein
VALFCGHSPSYIIQTEPSAPALCGLCFWKEGWESELPGRIHSFKSLAENGNPETHNSFLSHLVLSMGLIPPKKEQNLRDWRANRTSRGREQYTVRAPRTKHLTTAARNESFSRPNRQFPIASALWELMGYQPPLGIVLVKAVGGASEIQIAQVLDLSLYNVHVRLEKAIRAALGFLPNDDTRGRSGRGSEATEEVTGTDHP